MPTAFPTVYPIKRHNAPSNKSAALNKSGASPRSSACDRSSAAQGPIYAGRLFSRRAVDVRARLVMRRKENGRVVEVLVHGRTVDLSRSGAGLTLFGELPAGAGVVLCLQLPNSSEPLSHPGKPTTGSPGTPLCLRAVIVRRRGSRAGLIFVQPTAEQRLLLFKFCCA